MSDQIFHMYTYHWLGLPVNLKNHVTEPISHRLLAIHFEHQAVHTCTCMIVPLSLINYLQLPKQARVKSDYKMNMTCILLTSIIHMRQMANSARLGRLNLVG